MWRLKFIGVLGVALLCFSNIVLKYKLYNLFTLWMVKKKILFHLQKMEDTKINIDQLK